MANYSLFSTQVVYGELVNRTYIALDAANMPIVAEQQGEVKKEVAPDRVSVRQAVSLTVCPFDGLIL
jgi:hypothetical protein